MRHKKNASFFRRYGAGLILLALFIGSTAGFWHQGYAKTRHEAESACDNIKAHDPDAKCPIWEAQDQRTHFWDGMWENVQSEYQQLLLQFLLMVAFASWLAYKEKEGEDEILDKLDELKRELEQLKGPEQP